jgi:hypothetical protein
LSAELGRAHRDVIVRIVREVAVIGGYDRNAPPRGAVHLLRFGVGASLIAAAVVGALVGLLHVVVHVQNDALNDTSAYYHAAERLNAGEPLYPPGEGPLTTPQYYVYPPLLAIALRPFALLPFPVFAVLWEAGTIAVFYLFVRRVGFNRRTAIALGLLGSQIGDVLTAGQAQAHVTWLMALGQPWSVALAGQLKIFPALVAVYWIGRGDYRKLLHFISWSVALVVLQLVLAPAATMDFTTVLPLDNVGTFTNLSPYQFSRPLWFFLVFAFLVVSLLLARTRFGWAAAASYATLATPQLFGYHLLSLGAALRAPDPQAPDTPPPDAAAAMVRSTR